MALKEDRESGSGFSFESPTKGLIKVRYVGCIYQAVRYNLMAE
jgi:hypothetical protein